ncbi:hypothetical protein C8R46DRAFT_1214033 [Mycena filopes]|nr:hypothetical protein C8R46DRAFT_1214033 [Mycena filopes]
MATQLPSYQSPSFPQVMDPAETTDFCLERNEEVRRTSPTRKRILSCVGYLQNSVPQEKLRIEAENNFILCQRNRALDILGFHYHANSGNAEDSGSAAGNNISKQKLELTIQRLNQGLVTGINAVQYLEEIKLPPHQSYGEPLFQLSPQAQYLEYPLQNAVPSFPTISSDLDVDPSLYDLQGVTPIGSVNPALLGTFQPPSSEFDPPSSNLPVMVASGNSERAASFHSVDPTSDVDAPVAHFQKLDAPFAHFQSAAPVADGLGRLGRFDEPFSQSGAAVSAHFQGGVDSAAFEGFPVESEPALAYTQFQSWLSEAPESSFWTPNQAHSYPSYQNDFFYHSAAGVPGS